MTRHDSTEEPRPVNEGADSKRGVVSSGLGTTLVRYGLIGVISFGLDFGALTIGYSVLSAPLWAATSAGFWLSFLVNFTANKYWTFDAAKRTGRQVVRYALLIAMNYPVTLGIVTGLAAVGVNFAAAKLSAVVVLTGVNFLAYRHWVFASPKVVPVTLLSCCVCESTMQQMVTDWCYRCSSCGTWASTLPMGINGQAHARLDEKRRETGLSELRQHNDQVVVNRLLELGLPPDATLLDVGSAFGWFVLAAREHGLTAEGVEPDLAVLERSDVPGVRHGFFPDALQEGEKFDAITYNDVLEHFPDAGAAVAHSAARLNPGGLLSVNIPNSRGLFFRLARLVHPLGLTSAFERLWQVGLPSPHLWFFDRRGLTELGQKHGLEVVAASPLDSVRRSGLWHRAHSDRNPSPTSVLGVALVWLAAPLFNGRRASDIMHVVFRKPTGVGSDS